MTKVTKATMGGIVLAGATAAVVSVGGVNANNCSGQYDDLVTYVSTTTLAGEIPTVTIDDCISTKDATQAIIDAAKENGASEKEILQLKGKRGDIYDFTRKKARERGKEVKPVQFNNRQRRDNRISI